MHNTARFIGLVLLVSLPLAWGCAATGETPNNYEGYHRFDDGTEDGRAPRAAAQDAPITDASVTHLNAEELVSRLGARPDLMSPSPRLGRTPMSRADVRASAREYVLRHARSREPAELVRVVLDLGDFPFPEVAYLRELSQEQRDLIIEDRRERIDEAQQEIVEYLESIGAVIYEQVGAFNQVRAEIPAGAIEDVLRRPDVEAVHPSWEPAFPLYDLDEAREATFISEFWAGGFEGEAGSRAYGYWDGSYFTQKVAVIEVTTVNVFPVGGVPNRLDTDRSGWRDEASGPSRVKRHADCTGLSGISTCPTQPDGGGAHGTWVTSVLTGDITAGQDPNITDPQERLRRTGMVPEASIYYYNGLYPDELAVAIFNAVARGADIINLSLGVACGDKCDPTEDCGGLNNMIRFATQSGTVVVAAAGNSDGLCTSPGPPDCNVCLPAIRPEVLSVANVDTSLMFGPVAYDDADIHPLSSSGYLRVGVAGQWGYLWPNGVDIPAVSIAAPGVLSHFFLGPDGGYMDYSEMAGTSFASPIVAAGAALMREEAVSGQDPFPHDVSMMKARVLARGDGTGSPGTALSPVWGTGRVKFHPYDALEAPKGTAYHRFTLNENELVTLGAHGSSSLPPDVTEWRMGMDIKWGDMSAIPYVVIQYFDVCGGTRPLLTDFLAGLERRALFDSSWFDADTCIEIRVNGYSIPPGGVEISIFEYYHSGDPANH